MSILSRVQACTLPLDTDAQAAKAAILDAVAVCRGEIGNVLSAPITDRDAARGTILAACEALATVLDANLAPGLGVDALGMLVPQLRRDATRAAYRMDPAAGQEVCYRTLDRIQAEAIDALVVDG